MTEKFAHKVPSSYQTKAKSWHLDLLCNSLKILATLPILSLVHRRVGIPALATLAGVCATVSVFAQGANEIDNYVLKNPDPQTLEQVTSEISSIQDFLKTAQCGGWNRDVSVGDQPGQMISKVLGAPGREGEPLGNIASGMAKRKEEFSFPDGTQGGTPAAGFVTACKGNPDKKTQVKVYCPGDPPADAAGTPSRNCTRESADPFFMDPHACLWRGGDEPLDPPLTQGMCQGFCNYLNDGSFTFDDCRKVERIDNKWKCTQMDKRWVCSDDWVNSGNANCKLCTGASCRCPGPGCELSKKLTPYRSFFRRYTIQTYRQVLPEADGDLMADVKANAQCYGFYKEFDARTTITNEQKDGRCVIANIETSGEPYDPEKLRLETQKGKGKYVVNQLPPDALPGSRPYDANKDIWYTKVMGAFSFLKPKEDLASGLLAADKAKVTATVQNTVEQPYMAESILRATDDSASNNAFGFRPLTTWWQKFATDGQRIFTPPIVRLRLPATWNQSLSALNPVSVTPVVSRDRRTESIEVQLQAKDDLAGLVADQLKRSLMLDVREEPVPIVVPMGSPVEFRAAAQQWEEWRDRRKEANAAVPGEVDQLIVQLKNYALAIESVRAVRAQLPLVFASLLEKQEDFLVGINAWVEQNRQTLLTYVLMAEKRAKLKPLWEKLASEQIKFADSVNTPWCKNDRFTTPIYSLLDPWMPARPDLNGGIPSCAESSADPLVGPVDPSPTVRPGSLPILCIPQGESELVYDLSRLKVTTGAVVLPVLKPIQVRMNIPKPGSPSEAITDVSKLRLPDLPQVPDITQDFVVSIPSAQTLSAPTSLPAPVSASTESLEKTLVNTQKMLADMNKTYEKFWTSLEYLDPDESLPVEERVPMCPTRDGGMVMMAPLDCCSWGDFRCAHTEVDLLERFTRITARPGILLKEDLQSVGAAQTRIPVQTDKGRLTTEVYAKCTPTDHTCQPLLPVKEPPQDGWQIIFPQQQQALSLDKIRATARSYTLKPDGSIVGNPALPFVPSAQDLHPSFTVPGSYDLRVPKNP